MKLMIFHSENQSKSLLKTNVSNNLLSYPPQPCSDIILLKQTLIFPDSLDLLDKKPGNSARKRRKVVKSQIPSIVSKTTVEINEHPKHVIIKEDYEEKIIEDGEEEVETENIDFEEYRNMPLSLSKLNKLEPNFDCRTLNCQKPKKFWMQKIESECKEDVGGQEKQELQERQKCYKIKMQNNDKLILQLDKDKLKECEEMNDFYDSNYEEIEDLEGNDLACPSSATNERGDESLIDEIELECVEFEQDNETIMREVERILDKESHFIEINLFEREEENNWEEKGEINEEINEKKSYLNENDEKIEDKKNLKFKLSDKGIKYHINDVIWAKITGYPHWPGKIHSFIDEKTARINWYAWNEVSFIRLNNLYHFQHHFNDKFQKKIRSTKYKQSVSLAKYDSGMLISVAAVGGSTRTASSTAVTSALPPALLSGSAGSTSDTTSSTSVVLMNDL